MAAEVALEAAGWLYTRELKWQDPVTSVTYDAMAAVEVLNQRRRGTLSEEDLETFLYNLIDADKEEFEIALHEPFIAGLKTFEEDSIPSDHHGLIITTKDGSEFKLTIVKVSGG